MFVTPLRLRADSVPDMWVLDSPLRWRDGEFGTIEVPAGFRTDLASIPRVFRNLPFLDPNGVSRRPAVVHDWLYASARRTGKAIADQFLRASMIDEGSDALTAAMFYWAVHYFGGLNWKSDQAGLGSKDFDTAAHYQYWCAHKGLT